MAAAAAGSSALCSVNDNQKRWTVFGIALNKVLVEQIRPFVEQEVNKEYGKVKTSHGIDTQSTSGRLKHWPSFLKYENINGNDALPKVHGTYNYSVFDCRVTSHLDFAKLYVENFMAKFNAFDEHCDASAVVTLLGKVPVFSAAVQSAAGDVRQARNAWAHCAFSDWDPVKFRQSFDVMEQLAKALGLPAPDERTLLAELRDWEKKGTLLCMNTPVDPALLQLVQHHVNTLKTDVDKLTFDVDDERGAVKKTLHDVEAHLKELENRVERVEEGVKDLQDEQIILQQRVTQVEEQVKAAIPRISSEISSCEADVLFFAERHDADTRQWLFDDFNNWFRDPGDSRAYVLLGDAGVGKSVMAGALAQRTREAGQLGAAYFCRHNDGTRNDPRYLLGTVACQLIECKSDYGNIVGGEGGVRLMLANSKLGVLELFTKLLQEPLAKCTHCERRKLVIIDALDETEYQSREDFLDLLMHRFPLLPRWLVFFITSRPEDTVQFRLKKYNPCIKICAGDGEHLDFYQQHERDIRRFLEKRLDISRLPYSLEDVTAKCNGLFLYAYYIVEVLNDPIHSGMVSDLNDLFPGDIDEFFRENFKRIFDKVGADLYRKLFGCVIAAPSPLPLSFISFILKRENSDLEEQEVIDSVSQFVVLRTSDETFTFLHSLIPSWLTDSKKASRRLLIDKIKAGEYLRDIILVSLPSVVDDQKIRLPSVESDLVDYLLRVGVRVLCGYDEKDSLDTVYSCLTSYQFIQKRIQSSQGEIYSVVDDLKLSARCQALGDAEREILQEMYTVLESNIHSLLQCPHLLLSCLGNTSKALQCKLAIPDDVSATWLGWKGLSFPVCEIPRDMSCFALSPNKMLLAGGKDQSISLFNACSLEKILGPITVLESTNRMTHLEFTPDGKFVFYGRLDRLFSVERECVQEFCHFSGKTGFHGWGCFVSDGRYLVVEKGWDMTTHRIECLFNVFYMWATEEVNQIQLDGTASSCDRKKSSEELVDALEAGDLPSILTGMQYNGWCPILEKMAEFFRCRGLGLCNACLEFKRKQQQLTLAVVRQRVIDLYAHIFQYQVWDVQNGKPVLGEVFSSSVQLSLFLFLCHLPALWLRECETLFSGVSKSLSLCRIALINAVYIMDHFEMRSSRQPRFPLFVPKNMTKEFYDHIGAYRKSSVSRGGDYMGIYFWESKCSPDKTWIAVRGNPDYVFLGTNSFSFRHLLERVRLFRSTSQNDKHVCSKPVYDIGEVTDFDFTRSSKVIVYVTKGKLLQALSLETGTILSSVSGLSPLYDIPKRQVAFVFCTSHDQINIFMDEFPTSLLRLSSPPPDKVPVGVAFTSETSIQSLYADSLVTSWKTSDCEGLCTFVTKRCLDRDLHPSGERVKKCAFSKGGELIAFYHASVIRLFRNFVFVSVVFRGLIEEHEWNVSWLTFSADSTLLLYCIQRINDYASVHAWDVQKMELSASFRLQQTSIDCCYLSSDNSKLIICGEFSVEIRDYNGSLDLLTRLEPGRLCVYSRFDKFSYCTVSADNELLACCIADGIHLSHFCIPTGQSFRQLPHGHLGRIEFCQFLKGTRYLISYGVDGAVFLWDLCEWTAVACARIAQGRESIVSMDVSPEENKAVCLTSFNRLILINFCGLKSSTIPLTFAPVGLSGSHGLALKTSRGQLPEQAMSVLKSRTVSNDEGIAESTDVDQLLEEMDFVMASEDSEDGDENESDEMLIS